MKRITEEQAERMPHRLKINDSKCNQVRHGWEYHYHHRIHTWNHIYRFICKYINKKWNDCFSEYKKFIKSERIFRRFSEEYINSFYNYFSSLSSSRHKDFCDFTVDEEGFIRTTSHYNRPRVRKPVYRKIIYKYSPKYPGLSEYQLKKSLGCKLFYSIKQTGIDEEEYLALKRKLGLNFWDFTAIPIGEPIQGKKAICKFKYEKASKKRKYLRKVKNEQKKALDSITIKSFATRREQKKALKKRALNEAKIEEAFNIVERDRLGFDEESFKTPQKFTK